jgi:hypothetical protein
LENLNQVAANIHVVDEDIYAALAAGEIHDGLLGLVRSDVGKADVSAIE